MSQTYNTSYQRVLRYALQYKLFFVLSIVGFVLFGAMEALIIKTLEFFIDRLEGRESQAFFTLSTAITSSLLFVPIAIVILSFFRGIGSFLGNFFLGLVGIKVVTAFRRDVFAKMVHLPQRYFDEKNSGELLSLIIFNIEQVSTSVTDAVKILFRDGLQVIIFLVAMLLINWKITLIFLGAAPVIAAIVYLAGQYFRKVSHKIQHAIGHVSHIATESIQGIKLVKSFSGEHYEKERFNAALKENLKYAMKFSRVNALQTPVLHFVLAIALAVVFYIISLYWGGNSSTAIVFATYAGAITKPFRQLSKINSLIQKGMAAADTIFDVLDKKSEVDNGQQTLSHVKGNIRFDQVSFSYNAKNTALNNISFTVEPGQSIALVGSSGSGKSTLVNLLLRFYENDNGHIYIDDQAINTLTKKSLRDNIALVSQNTTLFNATIANNIQYGQSHKTRDQIVNAAKQANAHDFISALENGYDTIVGEDGAMLSGGQRQRIAIARALLKNAPILVLDEATSALDNESEKAIQHALDQLKHGRTTITIAHRLSTIEQSDTILVLDHGNIIESGTHEQLISQQDAYFNLYNSHNDNAS